MNLPTTLPMPEGPSTMHRGRRTPVQTRRPALSKEVRAALDARLRCAAAKAQAPDSIPLRDPHAPTPLSFAQEQLWLLEQVIGGTPAYNIALVHRLRGRLETAAFEAALTRIIERHESLRTTFAESGVGPIQRIHKPGTVTLPIVDLHDLPSYDRLDEAHRPATAQARVSFDLHAGPLVRFHLWRLDHDDHVLGVFWHHLVADGWSLGVFVRELTAGYVAALSQRAVPPGIPALQYADFAAWQRFNPAQNARERDESYWKERLTGAPPLLELPTDRPRPGVQRHRGDVVLHSLDERIARKLEEFSQRADDIVLAVTTVSFDIAGLEMYLPLTTGARVAIVSGETAADGAMLARHIELHGATMLQATPATWRFLLDAGWNGKDGLKALCGGEALTPELARVLLPRCAELWNMHGPTETTIWSSCCRVQDADTISIGRPIHNTYIHIVDTNMQPVPAGVPGELLIGGAGPARGCHERPELTAEKFIGDPFNASGRLYRTGDVARFRSNGGIECLGRLDHQVKLRGFRIELGEIESTLAAHPAIAQAVVVLGDAPSPGDDKQLVAFLVTRDCAEPLADELRSHVAARVPAYMVPARFAVVAAFPLNSNGKIDRRALLVAPRTDLSMETDCPKEPRTPIEAEVLSIWQRVLGRKDGGIRENFFDVGGHSLLATRLVRELQAHFNTTFPLRRLFEAPTVEQIAASLPTGPGSLVHRVEADRSLRGSRPGTPLFFIPDLAGFEFIPENLADQIAGSRPYFDALQMPGADHRQAPLHRIEDIAAVLVRQVRAVRPHGPYVLVGFCFGGLVVYEVARQIEAAGEPIEALVRWHAFHAGAWRKRHMPETVRHLFQRCRQKTFHEHHRAAADKARFLAHQARIQLENVRDRILGRENLQRMEGIDFLPSAVHRALVGTNLHARERYRPQPFRGRTYIINGNTDRIRHECLPLDGWHGLLCGSVELHHLECEHLALLQPPWSGKIARLTAAFLRASAAEIANQSR